MNTTIPELSDEQIESMRFAIMSDVDKSTRTRARSYRRVLVTVVTVIALGGIGSQVIGSNSGSQSDSASRASSGSADRKATSPGSVQAESGSDSAKSALKNDRREIVTTGSLGMTVAHPTDTASKISAVVSSAGGRVDSRSETAPEGDNGGHVHLVVRIPQTKVDGTIDVFRSYGKMDYVNVDDVDVTAQGKDLDARIKALRISVARLEGLMKNANTTSELLRAENALTTRQAELDSLVSQRTGLSDQVALSSLGIELSPKVAANSVSPSGFWGGVVSGWNGLVATIDGAVHLVGLILPWGVALGLLTAVGWLVTRRRSSRVA